MHLCNSPRDLLAAAYLAPSSSICQVNQSQHNPTCCKFMVLQAIAQYLVNLNVWSHNLLVLLGRAAGKTKSAEARSACQHCRWQWLATTLFVVSYSWLISVFLPYFSSLVGIVASSTYLVCAYTLPCWFALKLFSSRMWRGELWLCHILIPVSLLLSAAGLVSSIRTLISDIQSHGSGFGPPV